MTHEQLGSNDRELEPTNRFELLVAKHNPQGDEAIIAYEREKDEEIESGAPRIRRRNFDPTNGDVFDLYFRGQLVGYVEGSDDHSVDVYYVDEEARLQKLGETITKGSYSENMMAGIDRVYGLLQE